MTGVEPLLLTLVGWFASPVIKSVYEKAQKYLSDNYELQEDAKGMVMTLTRKLVICQDAVEKVERRMINNSTLTTWLKMLKDAVYDAEDVLDNMEAKSIKEKLKGRNKVSEVASSSLSDLTNVIIPDDNLKSLKEVLDKLTEISDEIPTLLHLLGLNENDGQKEARGSKYNFKETISKPSGEVAKYRQKELKLILEIILRPESGSRKLEMILHPELESSEKKEQNCHGPIILPVVGIGGVGKTTLAQAIYNNPGVEQTFEKKEWISVSSNLDVIMLMRILYQSFGGSLSSDVLMTLQYISEKLSSIICGLKFLVVLDDTFEKIEEQWDVIHNTLSHGAPGSVVIITTQNQTFAYRVATIGPIVLSPLELENFWELFKSFAFGECWDIISWEKRNNLEVFGRRIAGKLGGLPLAAKIIGEILRRNIDLDKWRKISKSEWWEIPEGRSKILPSIAIGYQHLDSCLRQCFAFCSIFPRNSLIDKDRLVQMWIAQNFIPHDIKGARNMEDTGRKWFDKLIEMSFFQPAGDYKGYVMPNLMHDLAVIVSSDECFYLTDQSLEIPKDVRHLAVDAKNLELLKRIPKQNRIRSFLYFGFSHVDGVYSTINETISNLDSIRVLDLSYLHMETKEPPTAIQNMTHLRFLDLSSTGIVVLTHSKFDLYHLQTLHIRKCSLIELPIGMNRLINLRHLNADSKTIALISGIGQLVNLQELDEYIVGKKKGHRITELENLRELTGHLRISNCENIKSKKEAEYARLHEKKGLNSIELCWSSVKRESNIDMEILEGLKPHEEINELTIDSYMGSSIPVWLKEMGHFLNLQTVRLISCINIQALPPLEQLPSLSTIEIVDNLTLREVPLHCFSASLKALKIVGCYNLKSLGTSLCRLTSLCLLHIINYKMRISLNTNVLRLLEDLMLRDCPQLRIQGELQSLANLKYLEINNCPVLSIQGSLKSLKNLKHLLITSCPKLTIGIRNENHPAESLQFLSYLEIDQSLLHNDFHLILGRLPSLRFLNCKNLLQFTMDQTLWFQELTLLQELIFCDCEFKQLPSSFAKLSSLKKLKLMTCTNIEWLPAEGMPPFLQELSLEACSPQFVRCCKPDGRYWELISHVPLIRIDGGTIDRPQTPGVELLVGGWFASPVIRRVVEKAQNFLSAKELHEGTQGLVETLTHTLVVIETMIEEAEKRMINNSNLVVWLRMLKDTVYNAEDVLDNMEAKSTKQKIQRKNMVSKFISSSLYSFKNAFTPDDAHKRLKEVLDKLEKIYAEIPDITIEMNNFELWDERKTISRQIKKVGLYCRQRELKLISEMILDPVSGFRSNPESGSNWDWRGRLNFNNYKGLLVVPIVGMGGVGKTALAQAVYNKLEVQQTFASKAWISVANNLDVVRLMHNIFESFSAYPSSDMMTLEVISKNLSSIIGGVRFLVVLDDMFEKIELQWDNLYAILSCGAPGSVVLITTHNQAFADKVGTLGHVALKPLEWGVFWELFKHFAFGNVVISEERRNNLELIGEQIARKLNGLPLEAKIIGKLLRHYLDKNKWRRISISEWWDMPEGRNKILPSIAIGYQHLDPCLRQCFAFCSVFPRNSVIDKNRLVQMWIAQNFIPFDSNDDREIENIGREWFDKLVEMSFFQPTGDYKGYVMPNLMHDLAVIVSSHECFYLTDQLHEIPQGIRHLAVDTKNLNVLKRIPKQNHIRSFFNFGCNVDGMFSSINEILSNLDRIRILDLSYLHMETKEPPPAVQNMPHLRFLDLSFTGIEVLTHCRFDHYHLQALHIQKCPLTKLPRGINKLINLQHLNTDAETIALISGIGQLVNLQELDEYSVGKKEGYKITELKNLSEIKGHLRIRDCENIENNSEAEQSRLADKDNLNSVELCWSSAPRESKKDKEILEDLAPFDGIKELKIYNYLGSSFPNWMKDISHFFKLRTIRLVKCLNVEVLPPLGKLPSLKHLELEELDSVKMIDHCFCGNNHIVFPALTYFKFFRLSSCEKWTEPLVAGFIPHLSTLELMYNDALNEAPLHFFSASLKALKIVGCYNLNSLAESLHHLTSLSLLHIVYYEIITSLHINGLALLKDLKLKGCPELSIEGDLQSLANLKHLEITGCPKLLSNSMHNIMSKIKGKGLQVHQAEGLRSLSYLEMDESLLCSEYHLILGRLPSLRFLHFVGSEPTQFTMDQAFWIQELTSLQELAFWDSEFRQLPSSLAKLSSLRKIMLNSCVNLESLPANGMPPFLWELAFHSCSENLVQRCQPDKGEDWKLISHVLLVRIDGKTSRPQCLDGTSG